MFLKSMLRDGMVVEYRNGHRRIVFEGSLYAVSTCDGAMISSSELDVYSEDMCRLCEEVSSLDIVKVFSIKRDFSGLDLLWERREISKEERRVCDILSNAVGADVMYDEDPFSFFYQISDDGKLSRIDVELLSDEEEFEALAEMYKFLSSREKQNV